MAVTRIWAGAIMLALLAGASPPILEPDLGEQPVYSGLFRVGATGIHCYQEPCPRMGIVAADAPRALHPLWSGKAPPVLHGAEDDRRRIIAAWEAGECVIVRGNLLPDAALQVKQVIGPC